MSMAERVIKTLHAEELTREAAPGLYSAMEDVAAKLHIKMPTFHLVPDNIPHAHPMLDMLSKMPNAGSISKEHIILSKPLLNLLNSGSLQHPISEKLKGILAHEMHHCGHRPSSMLMSRAPVLLFPVFAAVGMYIYDRVHAKAKEQGDTSKQALAEGLDKTTEELHETLPKEVKESGFLKSVLYHSRYFAAIALGLGAGLLAARYGSRYHEFAADAFAAGTLNNKETMVDALRDIIGAVGQSISETHVKEKFKGIIGETILAHPSFAERAANIRH